MKVALITTWDVDCGVAGYSRGLHEGLLGRGVEVEILPIDRTELRYRTREELRAWARELGASAAGADVAHVQHEHGIFAGSYGYAASLRVFHNLLEAVAPPAAVTFHTEPWPFAVPGRSLPAHAMDLARRSAWFALVARDLNKRADRLAVTHNRAARRQLLDAGVADECVRVVPQGVPEPTAPPLRSPEALAARERLGFAPEHVVLTCFGFVTAHKGLDDAARALLDLPEHFRLLVAGAPHPHDRDDALDELLEVVAERPELRERVTLTGRVDLDRLRDLHAATDICLAPYRKRPHVASSAAITWALAAGRPVVASYVPAFVELSDLAGCVELVAPEAPHELAWTVERLAGDSARQEELVARASEYAAAASWDRAAEGHVALYDELVRE